MSRSKRKSEVRQAKSSRGGATFAYLPAAVMGPGYHSEGVVSALDYLADASLAPSQALNRVRNAVIWHFAQLNSVRALRVVVEFYYRFRRLSYIRLQRRSYISRHATSRRLCLVC
jgi:hypothetical protein